MGQTAERQTGTVAREPDKESGSGLGSARTAGWAGRQGGEEGRETDEYSLQAVTFLFPLRSNHNQFIILTRKPFRTGQINKKIKNKNKNLRKEFPFASKTNRILTQLPGDFDLYRPQGQERLFFFVFFSVF